MNIYNSKLYIEDVQYVAGLDLPWEKLKGKSIMLSGGTGLLGSFFIDVIMEKNSSENFNCKLYILGRDKAKAELRFSHYKNNPYLVFLHHDVKKPLIKENIGIVDYVLHLASNTHPLQYSTEPIGTITTNVIGLMNMLNFSIDHNASRFVFASSNEIYGENRGDVELFDEDYCGYINSNTMRAGYPESKRCGESLCQAYKEEKGLDIVIPRFTRSYGPTMQMSDTKAISQFIKSGITGENIILKSDGTQFYSYTYVADAISGFLTILLKGKNGEAYNIADEMSDIMLKDLALIIAEINDKKVVFEVPDKVEAAGYSKATKARLSGKKLVKLGWKPKYNIKSGLERTIQILKEIG